MPPGTHEQFVHPSCKNIDPTRKYPKKWKSNKKNTHNRAVLECFDSYHLEVFTREYFDSEVGDFDKSAVLEVFLHDFWMIFGWFSDDIWCFLVIFGYFWSSSMISQIFQIFRQETTVLYIWSASVLRLRKTIFLSVSGVSQQKNIMLFNNFTKKPPVVLIACYCTRFCLYRLSITRATRLQRQKNATNWENTYLLSYVLNLIQFCLHDNNLFNWPLVFSSFFLVSWCASWYICAGWIVLLDRRR